MIHSAPSCKPGWTLQLSAAGYNARFKGDLTEEFLKKQTKQTVFQKVFLELENQNYMSKSFLFISDALVLFFQRLLAICGEFIFFTVLHVSY